MQPVWLWLFSYEPFEDTFENTWWRKAKQMQPMRLWSSNEGALRTHLKMHSGEKSNKCNQCGYASSHMSHLRTHLKTHSGEKSNKCNQCEYASSHASTLRTHLKTHIGKKSNKCNQCDYASSLAGNMKTHLKRHSGEMWLCIFTDRSFEEIFENARCWKVTKAIWRPSLGLTFWENIWKKKT